MRERLSQRGQSLVEFAVILPVLAILLMGLLDLGRLYYAYVAVTDASAQGAAYGATYGAKDNDDVEAITQRAADATAGFVQITNPGDQVTVITDTNTVSVTVVYSFTVLTPLVNGMVENGVIPLRATTAEAMLVGVIE